MKLITAAVLAVLLLAPAHEVLAAKQPTYTVLSASASIEQPVVLEVVKEKKSLSKSDKRILRQIKALDKAWAKKEAKMIAELTKKGKYTLLSAEPSPEYLKYQKKRARLVARLD